ncbi:MAG TPA: hypothetical protein VLM39_12615, partial [Ignavibacteriaceae bacterium]|nr:hypothetical protein [Ignavibacteriaceae bacterium]
TEIKKISRDADVILTGKVLRQHCLWNKNKTKIFTNVTVEVEEYLKGSRSDKNILITHPGGEIGEIGEWYSHTPGFKDDEEVLLFLRKDSKNDIYKVVNGEDGKLSLHTDKKTGEKITSSHVAVSVLKKEIENVLK